MPYNPTSLAALLQGSGFTLWLYRTTDTRAEALAPGYFEPAAPRLEAGDIILLQAADAVSLLPVRAGDFVAAGLTLDTAPAAFRAERQATQKFRFRQAVEAVARSILLAPIAAGLLVGGTIEARAAVHGPVPQVVFTLLDAFGVAAQAPQLVPVTSGSASAEFPAEVAGIGWRIRVEAADDPAVSDLSPPFVISPPFGLLDEGGRNLARETGGMLLL